MIRISSKGKEERNEGKEERNDSDSSSKRSMYKPKENPLEFALTYRKNTQNKVIFIDISTIEDYVDYVKNNFKYMIPPSGEEGKLLIPESLIEYLLYHIFKKDIEIFEHLPLHSLNTVDTEFINDVVIIPESGNVYEIDDRKTGILVGITTDNKNKLVFYFPDDFGVSISTSTYDDISLPSKSRKFRLVKGQENFYLHPNIVSLLNTDLLNMQNHNKLELGKQINKNFKLFADDVIRCTQDDSIIPISRNLLSRHSPYFKTYLSQTKFKKFKNNIVFQGKCYLIEYYIYYLLTGDLLNPEIVFKNLGKLIDFANYIGDIEYLDFIYRSALDFYGNQKEIDEFVGSVLNMPPEMVEWWLDEEYTKYNNRVVELYNFRNAKPSDLTRIITYDGVINVNQFEKFELASQSPYFCNLFIKNQNVNEIKVPFTKRLVKLYQKYLLNDPKTELSNLINNTEKKYIITNIWEVLQFAQEIKDYGFLRSSIMFFLEEPNAPLNVKQEINEYLLKFKKKKAKKTSKDGSTKLKLP
jgi:hypothetical protein